MSSLRFRIPTDLGDRLAARAARDGAPGASSISTAVALLYRHVDDDLRGAAAPRRVMGAADAPSPAPTRPQQRRR